VFLIIYKIDQNLKSLELKYKNYWDKLRLILKEIIENIN